MFFDHSSSSESTSASAMTPLENRLRDDDDDDDDRMMFGNESTTDSDDGTETDTNGSEELNNSTSEASLVDSRAQASEFGGQGGRDGYGDDLDYSSDESADALIGSRPTEDALRATSAATGQAAQQSVAAVIYPFAETEEESLRHANAQGNNQARQDVNNPWAVNKVPTVAQTLSPVVVADSAGLRAKTSFLLDMACMSRRELFTVAWPLLAEDRKLQHCQPFTALPSPPELASDVAGMDDISSFLRRLALTFADRSRQPAVAPSKKGGHAAGEQVRSVACELRIKAAMNAVQSSQRHYRRQLAKLNALATNGPHTDLSQGTPPPEESTVESVENGLFGADDDQNGQSANFMDLCMSLIADPLALTHSQLGRLHGYLDHTLTKSLEDTSLSSHSFFRFPSMNSFMTALLDATVPTSNVGEQLAPALVASRIAVYIKMALTRRSVHDFVRLWAVLPLIEPTLDNAVYGKLMAKWHVCCFSDKRARCEPRPNPLLITLASDLDGNRAGATDSKNGVGAEAEAASPTTQQAAASPEHAQALPKTPQPAPRTALVTSRSALHFADGSGEAPSTPTASSESPLERSQLECAFLDVLPAMSLVLGVPESASAVRALIVAVAYHAPTQHVVFFTKHSTASVLLCTSDSPRKLVRGPVLKRQVTDSSAQSEESFAELFHHSSVFMTTAHEGQDTFVLHLKPKEGLDLDGERQRSIVKVNTQDWTFTTAVESSDHPLGKAVRFKPNTNDAVTVRIVSRVDAQASSSRSLGAFTSPLRVSIPTESAMCCSFHLRTAISERNTGHQLTIIQIGEDAHPLLKIVYAPGSRELSFTSGGLVSSVEVPKFSSRGGGSDAWAYCVGFLHRGRGTPTWHISIDDGAVFEESGDNSRSATTGGARTGSTGASTSVTKGPHPVTILTCSSPGSTYGETMVALSGLCVESLHLGSSAFWDGTSRGKAKLGKWVKHLDMPMLEGVGCSVLEQVQQVPWAFAQSKENISLSWKLSTRPIPTAKNDSQSEVDGSAYINRALTGSGEVAVCRGQSEDLVVTSGTCTWVNTLTGEVAAQSTLGSTHRAHSPHLFHCAKTNKTIVWHASNCTVSIQSATRQTALPYTPQQGEGAGNALSSHSRAVGSYVVQSTYLGFSGLLGCDGPFTCPRPMAKVKAPQCVAATATSIVEDAIIVLERLGSAGDKFVAEVAAVIHVLSQTSVVAVLMSMADTHSLSLLKRFERAVKSLVRPLVGSEPSPLSAVAKSLTHAIIVNTLGPKEGIKRLASEAKKVRESISAFLGASLNSSAVENANDVNPSNASLPEQEIDEEELFILTDEAILVPLLRHMASFHPHHLKSLIDTLTVAAISGTDIVSNSNAESPRKTVMVTDMAKAATGAVVQGLSAMLFEGSTSAKVQEDHVAFTIGVLIRILDGCKPGSRLEQGPVGQIVYPAVHLMLGCPRSPTSQIEGLKDLVSKINDIALSASSISARKSSSSKLGGKKDGLQVAPSSGGSQENASNVLFTRHTSQLFNEPSGGCAAYITEGHQYEQSTAISAPIRLAHDASGGKSSTVSITFTRLPRSQPSSPSSASLPVVSIAVTHNASGIREIYPLSLFAEGMDGVFSASITWPPPLGPQTTEPTGHKLAIDIKPNTSTQSQFKVKVAVETLVCVEESDSEEVKPTVSESILSDLQEASVELLVAVCRDVLASSAASSSGHQLVPQCLRGGTWNKEESEVQSCIAEDEKVEIEGIATYVTAKIASVAAGLTSPTETNEQSTYEASWRDIYWSNRKVQPTSGDQVSAPHFPDAPKRILEPLCVMAVAALTWQLNYVDPLTAAFSPKSGSYAQFPNIKSIASMQSLDDVPLAALHRSMCAVFDQYIRPKWMLLLEVHQDKEARKRFMARCKFLIDEIVPLRRIELLLEQMRDTEGAYAPESPQTTEPDSWNNNRQQASGPIACNNNSNTGGGDSSQQPRSTGSVRLGFRRNAPSRTAKKQQNRNRNDTMAGSIMDFLLSKPTTRSHKIHTDESAINTEAVGGHKHKHNEDDGGAGLQGLRRVLASRRQKATDSLAAYEVLLWITSSGLGGKHFSPVGAFLAAREHAMQGTGKILSDSEQEAGATPTDDHEEHGPADNGEGNYLDGLCGCGLEQETKLRGYLAQVMKHAIKNSAAAQKASPTDLSDTQAATEAISLCALLAHSWDGTDLNVIKEGNVVHFLSKILRKTINSAAPSGVAKVAASPEASSPGAEVSISPLSSLIVIAQRRHLVQGNTVTADPPDVAQIQIDSNNVFGVQIENADAWLIAKQRWSFESDPHLLSPLIYYFETTVSLCLDKKMSFTTGVYNKPQKPASATLPDAGIFLNSEGTLTMGSTGQAQGSQQSQSTVTIHNFGPPSGLGDVIGCGMYERQLDGKPVKTVFFTHNGMLLGAASRPWIDASAFPTAVAVKSGTIQLQLNFGTGKQFLYDFTQLDPSRNISRPTPTMLRDAALYTLNYLSLHCLKGLSQPLDATQVSHRVALYDLVGNLSELVKRLIFEVLEGATGLQSPASPKGPSAADAHKGRLATHKQTLEMLLNAFDVLSSCPENTDATNLNITSTIVQMLLSERIEWVEYALDRFRHLLQRMSNDGLQTAIRQIARAEAEKPSASTSTTSDSVKPIADRIFDRLHSIVTNDTGFSPEIFKPVWEDGSVLAVGSGCFYSSQALPTTEVTRIGFKISRESNRNTQGNPLGGCYYVGLSHPKTKFRGIQELIARHDVFVLQDTDDGDQVRHLLLPIGTIPRNSQRRIYGHDDHVWLEFDPINRKITFYRNQFLIGVAFVNVTVEAPLYAIAYLFNPDAKCALLSSERPQMLIRPESVRRSKALATLQYMHAFGFNDLISNYIDRCLREVSAPYSKPTDAAAKKVASRNFQNILAALSILGGERDYSHCTHYTYGRVKILSFIGDTQIKAIAEDTARTVEVASSSLAPTPFELPIIANGSLSVPMLSTLVRTLRDAVFNLTTVAPLENDERLLREEITNNEDIASQRLHCEIVAFFNFASNDNESVLSNTPTFSRRGAGATRAITPALAKATALSPFLVRGPGKCSARLVGKEPLTFVFSGKKFPSIGVAKNNRVSLFSKTEMNRLPKDAMHKGIRGTLSWEEAVVTLKVGAIKAVLNVGHLQQPATPTTAATPSTPLVDDSFSVCFELADKDVVVVGGKVALPPRNTVFSVPAGDTGAATHHHTPCSSCGATPSSFKSLGRDTTTLCQICFDNWGFPLERYTAIHALGKYVLSPYPPKELVVDDVVSFWSPSAAQLSAHRSTNVWNNDQGNCVSLRSDAFVVSEPLPSLGIARCDITLSSVLCAAGRTRTDPLTALLNYCPTWKSTNRSNAALAQTIDLDTNGFRSSTELPKRSHWFGIRFVLSNDAPVSKTTELCIGFTTDTTLNPTSAADIDLLDSAVRDKKSKGVVTSCCRFSKLPAAWSKSHDTVSLFCALRDDGQILVAPSIEMLCERPTILARDFHSEGKAQVFVFSAEPVTATLIPGMVQDAIGASLVSAMPSIAIVPASVPIEAISENEFLLPDSDESQARGWTIFPRGPGDLFQSNEAVAIFANHETKRIEVLVDNAMVASRPMSDACHRVPLRACISLPIPALCLSFDAPVSSKRILARVVSTAAEDVGCVRPLDPINGGTTDDIWVRRKDVCFVGRPVQNGVDVGTMAAIVRGSVLARGKISAVSASTVSVDLPDLRDPVSSSSKLTFDISNEDTAAQALPSLQPLEVAEEQSPTTFDVGQKRFGQPRNASYNGIMFDVNTSSAIRLTEIGVRTSASREIKFAAFFRPGSHEGHEQNREKWQKLAEFAVTCTSGSVVAIPLPEPIEIEADKTFALFINTTNNCGVTFFAEEEGLTGGVGTVLDQDECLTVRVGRKSESQTPFAEIAADPRGFCGHLKYTVMSGSREPRLPVIVRNVPEMIYAEEGQLTVCRPLKTRLTNSLSITIDCLEQCRLLELGVPVMSLINAKLAQEVGTSWRYPAFINVYHTTSGAVDSNDLTKDEQFEGDDWTWAYATRLLMDAADNELILKIPKCELLAGRNYIGITIKCPGLSLVACDSDMYTAKGKCGNITNFAGKVIIAPKEAAPHDTTTQFKPGSKLNQSGSASYNGLMFDIIANSNIELEELYFVAQTTSVRVQCRLFWREGSIEGAANNANEWKEITNTPIDLTDHQEFSFGPLNLQLKANKRYAFYANTGSSSGVRFFAAPDGLSGDVGSEFDSDGVITVFIGRKSESVNPFSDISTDPRAFKGRIVYRKRRAPTAANTLSFPVQRGFIVSKLMLCISQLLSKGVPFTDMELIADAACRFSPAPDSALSRVNLSDIERRVALLLERVSLPNSAASVELPATTVDVLPTDSWPTLAIGDYGMDFSGRREQHRVTSMDKFKPNSLLPIHKNLYTGKPIHFMAHQHTLSMAPSSNMSFSETASEGEHFDIPEMDDDWITTYLTKHIEGIAPNVHAESLATKLIRNEDILYSTGAGGTHQRIRAEHCAAQMEGNVAVFRMPVASIVSHSAVTVTTPLIWDPTNKDFFGLQLRKMHPSLSIAVDVVSDRSLRMAPTATPIVEEIMIEVFEAAGDVRYVTTVKALHHADGDTEFPCPLKLSEGQCTTLADDNGYVTMKATRTVSSVTALVDRFSSLTSSLCMWSWKANGFNSIISRLEEPITFGKALSEQLGRAPGLLRVLNPYSPSLLTVTKTIALSIGHRSASATIGSFQGLLLYVDDTNGFVAALINTEVKADTTLTKVMHIPVDILSAENLWSSSLTISKTASTIDEHQQETCEFTCVVPDDIARFSHSPTNAMMMSVTSHPGLNSDTPTTNVPPTQAHQGTWEKFQPEHVSVIGNIAKLTSTRGGECVLGPVLPTSAISHFSLQVARSDVPDGKRLGGGHFAGIALEGFENYTIHFEHIKEREDSMWVVQDTHDRDSQAHQAELEPMPTALPDLVETNATQAPLVNFMSNTVLSFTFDPTHGSLVLTRGSMPPVTVFKNIPIGAKMRPFARLDNGESKATLVISNLSHSPLVASAGILTSPTTSFALGAGVASLNTAPPPLLTPPPPFNSDFVDVLGRCPRLRKLLETLTEGQRSHFETLWKINARVVSQQTYSSLELRQKLHEFTTLLEALSYEKVFVASDVESYGSLPQMSPTLGLHERQNEQLWFSLIRLLERRVVDRYTALAHGLYVRIPLDCVISTLPLSAEFLPCPIVPLKRFSATTLSDVTLWVFPMVDEEAGIALVSDPVFCPVVPNACILEVHEESIVSNSSARGFVAEGTGYTRLDAVFKHKISLTARARHHIITGILCALEHYHLHQLPFENVIPENIFVKLDNPAYPSVRLWNCYRLTRPRATLTALETITEGEFGMAADVWSAVCIAFQLLHETYAPPIDLPVSAANGSRGAFMGALAGSSAGIAPSTIQSTRLFVIPPALVETLAKGLIYERLHRPSMSDLLDAFEQVVDFSSDITSAAGAIAASPSTMSTHTTPLSPKDAPTIRKGKERSIVTGTTITGNTVSYNGIMFEVVAKKMPVVVTKVKFSPDTTGTAQVKCFTRPGNIVPGDEDESQWKCVFTDPEMQLVSNHELLITLDQPLDIPAHQRSCVYIHTTNSSGVSFYAENSISTYQLGDIVDENADLGITPGKKCEGASPFAASRVNGRRYFHGTIIYETVVPKDERRSTLFSKGANLSLQGFDCSNPYVSQVGSRVALTSSFKEEGFDLAQDSQGTVVRALLVGQDQTRVQILFDDIHRSVAWIPTTSLTATDLLPNPKSVYAIQPFPEPCVGKYDLTKGYFGTPLTFVEALNPVPIEDFLPWNSFGYVTQSLQRSGLVSIRFERNTVSLCCLAVGQSIIGRPSEDDGVSEWKLRVDFAAATITEVASNQVVCWNVKPSDEIRIVTQSAPTAFMRYNLGCRPALTLLSGRTLSLVMVPPAEDGFSPLSATVEASTPCRKRIRVMWTELNTLQVLVGTPDDDDDFTIHVEPVGAAAEGLTKPDTEPVTCIYGIPHDVTVPPTLVGQPVRIIIELPDEEDYDDAKIVPYPVNLNDASSELERPFCAVQQMLPIPNDKPNMVAFDPIIREHEIHTINLCIKVPTTGKVAIGLIPKDHKAEFSELWAMESSPPPASGYVYLTVVLDAAARHVTIETNTERLEVASGELTNYMPESRLMFTSKMVGAVVSIGSWGRRNAVSRDLQANMWKRVQELFGSLPSPHVVRAPPSAVRHSSRPSIESVLPNEEDTREDAVAMATKAFVATSASALVQAALVRSAESNLQGSSTLLKLFASVPTDKKVSVIGSVLSNASATTVNNALAIAITILSIPDVVAQPFVDMAVGIIHENITRLCSYINTNMAFGATILLVLFRAVSTHSRSTRHSAMRAICRIMEEARTLPPAAFVGELSKPILVMAHALFKRRMAATPVAQLALRMIGAHYSFYKRRGTLLTAGSLLGYGSSINFPVMLCASDIIDSIERGKPLPQAINLVQGQTLTRVETPLPPNGTAITFTYNSLTRTGCRVFEVHFEETRQGPIYMGWSFVKDGTNTSDAVGIVLQPNGSISTGPHLFAANLDVDKDPITKGVHVIIVTCSYTKQEVWFDAVNVLTNRRRRIRTSFMCDETERFTVPIVHFICKADGKLGVQRDEFKAEQYHDTKAVTLSSLLGGDAAGASAAHMDHPDDRDATCPPQSMDFYIECCELYDCLTEAKVEDNFLASAFTHSSPTTAADAFDADEEVQRSAPRSMSATELPQGDRSRNSMFPLLSSVVRSSPVAPPPPPVVTVTVAAPTVASSSPSSPKKPAMVPRRLIAHLTLVLQELGEGEGDSESIDITRMAPYLHKVQAFDAFLSALYPVLSEGSANAGPLAGVWANMKRLATQRLRERIMSDALKTIPTSNSMTGHGVRIHLLQARPSARKDHMRTLTSSIFFQLYEQLSTRPTLAFTCSPLFKVTLVGMGAIDAGGPYREVLSKLGEEIITEHPSGEFNMNPLFEKCQGSMNNSVMPAPIEDNAQQHMSMLIFFGKLLAFFIITEDVLPVDFPMLFWKTLVGEPRQRSLLQEVCPELLRATRPEELAAFDMDECLDELEAQFPGVVATFAAIKEEHAAATAAASSIHIQSRVDSTATPKHGFRRHLASSLPAIGGSSLPDDNTPLFHNDNDLSTVGDATASQCSGMGATAHEQPFAKSLPTPYQTLSKRLEEQLLGSYDEPMKYIRMGCTSVIPPKVLQSLMCVDLKYRVCGSPEVTVENLRKSSEDRAVPPTIRAFFWEAVTKMTNDDRSKLLQFATGQQRFPLKSKITIDYNPTLKGYPKSSTCFWKLTLPFVDSAATLYNKLCYAIHHCAAIDLDNNAEGPLHMEM